jgi:protein-S-isoprenylcysteine O-methyltransferase Ste14
MSRLPSLGPRGEGWVALQFLLLAAIAAAGIFVRVPLTDGGTSLFAGGVLVLLGLVLAWRAMRDLDASLSPLPKPLDSATLVESGLYGAVRHPIYAALILMAVGWSLASLSPLALALTALLAVVLDLKSRREEIWLRERFPDYPAYATRTKRFIPRVY